MRVRRTRTRVRVRLWSRAILLNGLCFIIWLFRGWRIAAVTCGHASLFPIPSRPC